MIVDKNSLNRKQINKQLQMSQNNNHPSNYYNQYPNSAHPNNHTNQSTHLNKQTYQSLQQTHSSSPSPLLPYHEYMALKNKLPNTQTTTQTTTTPPIHQYSPTPQPYHYQQNMYQHHGYHPQTPTQYNYTPLQPYNAYMQQKLQQSTVSLHTNIEPLPNQQKSDTLSLHQTSLPNTTSQLSKQIQKPQMKHNPSPNTKIPPTRKQYQPKSPNPKSSEQKHSFIQSANPSSSQKYKHRPRQEEDDYNMDLSSDGWSEEEEEQEMLYQKYQSKKYSNKSKTIHKKKDPLLDNPDQIRKWIQARRRNYPGLRKRLNQMSSTMDNQQNEQKQRQRQKEKQEMSKLQYKIRKKLIIVNGDSRSIMKKIKNIQILRRIVQDPRILTRQRKPRQNQNYSQSISEHKPKSFSQIDTKPHKIEALQGEGVIETETILIGEEDKLIEGAAVEQIAEEIVEQIMPSFINEDKQKDMSSESDSSIQPEQMPANKTPTHPLFVQTGEVIDDNNQQLPQLFQIIPKPQKPSPIENLPTQNPEYKPQYRQTRRQQKPLDPQSIIAHLKQKQNQDRQCLDKLFDYRSNSHTYNYRVQTLQTSLKLDEIFAESTYLLQAIRYIVKENFFDNT